MALSAFQPPCSHRYADPALPAPYKGRPLCVPTKTILKQPCSGRYADPALPAPYKGRPLYVPTKTIFTILLSQIRRPCSPSPIQRSTPLRTDQNDLNSLALAGSSPNVHAKVDPYTYRPKHSKHLFFTDALNSSPSVHAKADPHAYRPKLFQPSCSNGRAQQHSQCPCKGRPLHLPTKTHVNNLVLTDGVSHLSQFPCKSRPLHLPT